MISLPSVLAALGTFLFLYLQWSHNRSHYPPGPTPVPILGNIFDFTARELWLRVTKWADIYGTSFSTIQSILNPSLLTHL